ncbi:MAG: PQQ-binding-like beta-propeller repeat protein [Thermoanaerobaculia bacterium]|nr:PQQ-binding-like beta-propeller repeat protein [Thermoanaerobaculia bacterium]
MPHAANRSLLLLALLLTALPPRLAAADEWPSFRGRFAHGVADGQRLPTEWDAATGRNVRWKTPIPGLGHSSPVVWGDRVFVTTAVADQVAEPVLGDEGGIGLEDDREREIAWRIYALDLASGEVVWQAEPYRGAPRAQRHVKASHANSTPATDGKTVVAIFGSQGLVAFDVGGRELWRRDLGVLDPGLYGDPASQWGHSSSPVLWNGRVFVQVDRHADSYLAAYDLTDGREIWRVARDEKPIWATPTIRPTPGGAELIVVGGDFDRGYDPETGRELWRFARDLEVKTTTPLVAGDTIVLSGGYRGRPLYALAAGRRGDLGSTEGGEGLLWASEPGGPYTSTPVVVDGWVHFVRNTGILTVLSLATGETAYRERLEGNFSASPVASDGKIYLAAEEGTVWTVAAGPEFELLGRSDMGEPCLASPAIAGGTLLLRCRSHLWAIGATDGAD